MHNLKYVMKKVLYMCLMLIIFSGIVLAAPPEMEIPAVITVPAEAIPAERNAAQQLQKYLLQITGHNLSIQDETHVPNDQSQILVGNSARAKVLLHDIDWNNLGRDTVVIKTNGNKLILAGQRPRGAIYAVYQFLQKVAKCRWWTPTEHTIPHNPQLKIPELSVVYTPPFYYRQMHVVGFSWENDPEFQTIFHQDGQHQIQNISWGGHYSILGFVHTYYKLIRPQKYFLTHPEWFSDPANHDLPCTAHSKMPTASNSQLCLSASGLVDEMAKNALALIDQNPDAGIISISENDNTHYCHCAECLKLYKREGSWSGPTLRFVNAVAKKIHEQYPNFIVETLAYHGSEKPPKTIRPAKNVMIRLAPLGADFGHPLNSDWNSEARDNLLSWKQIAPQLFIWSYATNFHYYMMPHPNWDSIAADLRFFAANNVRGIFVEGDNRSKGVGDFVQLRAWLTGKLLWNPRLNQDELMDEFLNGYYGNAGPYLKKYIQLIQQSFDNQHRKLNSFNDDFSFLSLDTMNQGQKYFDAAMQAVLGDKVLLRRVQREKLSLDLCWIKFNKAMHKIAQAENKELLGPQNLPQALSGFVQTYKSYNPGAMGQGGASLQTLLPKLQAAIAADAPLPELAKNEEAIDVIDLQAAALSPSGSKDVAELMEDASASDGQAMALNGASSTWAATSYLENYSMILHGDKWHAYAMLRFELKSGVERTGKALSLGAHDRTHGKYFSQKSISVDSIMDDEYRLFDMGIFAPDGNTQLFIATVNNPAVERVFVDRILLLRIEN